MCVTSIYRRRSRSWWCRAPEPPPLGSIERVGLEHATKLVYAMGSEELFRLLCIE